MKRAGILFIALMFVGAAAYADVANPAGSTTNDRVGHWDLGIEGGGAFIGTGGLDDTGWIQSNLSYGVTPWLGLGTEVGWTETSNDRGGDTGLVEWMFDIIWRWNDHPWDSHLTPYLDLGLGAMWSYAQVDNADDQDDSSFAIKIGGGIDWWINDNWIINFDVSYHTATSDITTNANAADDDSIDFTTVTGGLKFVF